MTVLRTTGAGVLRFVQATSLDIVAGVLCGAFFAAWVTGAELPAAWYAVLGAATWVIYVVDHLLDSGSSTALSWRHATVRRWRRWLLPIALVLAIAAPWVALRTLPADVLAVAPLVILAAAVHLWWAQRGHRHWLPKETTAATVYVAGIWFAPLLSGRVEVWTLAPLALHWVAALLNLTAFSQFDWGDDRRHGRCSVVRDWGSRRCASFVVWVGVAAALAVAAVALAAPPSVSSSVVALLPLVVAPPLLLRHFHWFATADRYRLADGLFLLLALPPVVP